MELELQRVLRHEKNAVMRELECERYVIDELFSYPEVTINTSGIFDHYIENAGLFCRHYASDVLVDIDHINYYLKTFCETRNMESEQFYSGFRNLGVDGETYIRTRLENPEVYGDFWETYNLILFLDAEVKGGEFILTLYEIEKREEE